MGNKGIHAVAGAKGRGTNLDLKKALVPLTDQELVEQIETVAMTVAQEKAQAIAPDMIDVLDEVAQMSRSDSSRVAAAREILNQAHGRPEARQAEKTSGPGELTIQIVNFTVEGGASDGQEIDVEAPAAADVGPPGPVEVEVEDF